MSQSRPELELETAVAFETTAAESSAVAASQRCAAMARNKQAEHFERHRLIQRSLDLGYVDPKPGFRLAKTLLYDRQRLCKRGHQRSEERSTNVFVRFALVVVRPFELKLYRY